MTHRPFFWKLNQIVSAGLGGVDVTTTVERRERYQIQIRYERSVRERLDDVRKVSVVTHTGKVVPLERLAHVSTTWGPGAINSEDARLVAHVSFSPSGGAGDIEAVMDSLRSARQSGELEFPAGNFELQPVGSFQNQIGANNRLMWIVPTVILINLLLHYLHFRNLPISLVVFFGYLRSRGRRHDCSGGDGRRHEHRDVGWIHCPVRSGG